MNKRKTKTYRRSDGIIMSGKNKREVKFLSKKNKFTPKLNFKFKRIR